MNSLHPLQSTLYIVVIKSLHIIFKITGFVVEGWLYHKTGQYMQYMVAVKYKSRIYV